MRFLLAALLLASTPASIPQYAVQRTGWTFSNGSPDPPLVIHNNSTFGATIRFRGKEYDVPRFSIVTIW